MTKDEYDLECKKWEEFNEKLRRYRSDWDKITELYRELDVIHILGQLSKIKNGIYYSFTLPRTRIYSKEDLEDPKFILPGRNIPFSIMAKTDHDYSLLLDHFGEYVLSPIKTTLGRLIGLEYAVENNHCIIDYLITDKDYIVPVKSRYSYSTYDI